MKKFLAVAVLLAAAGFAEAGGYGFPAAGGGVIINNNNNNGFARRDVAVQNDVIRPRRPVLRFLFPRIALSRDARFGPPNAVRVGGGAFVRVR